MNRDFEFKKKEAIKLRAAGLKSLEIAQKLGVGKTSVLRWTKNVKLSNDRKNEIEHERKRGLRAWQVKHKEIADLRHKKLSQQGFEDAQSNKLFQVICALYWGEGGKTRRCFTLTNSDPDMIGFVGKWLVVNDYLYKVQITYYENNGLSEEEIINHWKKVLPKLGLNDITKYVKKGQGSNKILPYGVIHLIVNKADLHSLVMGGIDYLKYLAKLDLKLL